MGVDEIRDRIRAEHRELRSRLEGIASLLEQLHRGNAHAALELRERGLELYERLGHHVALEESLLVPALRENRLRAQGAERLVHEHHEQRELLRYLTGRLLGARLPSLLIARELETFADCLALDMAYEEDTLLAGLGESRPVGAQIEDAPRGSSR